MKYLIYLNIYYKMYFFEKDIPFFLRKEYKNKISSNFPFFKFIEIWYITIFYCNSPFYMYKDSFKDNKEKRQDCRKII